MTIVSAMIKTICCTSMSETKSVLISVGFAIGPLTLRCRNKCTCEVSFFRSCNSFDSFTYSVSGALIVIAHFFSEWVSREIGNLIVPTDQGLLLNKMFASVINFLFRYLNSFYLIVRLQTYYWVQLTLYRKNNVSFGFIWSYASDYTYGSWIRIKDNTHSVPFSKLLLSNYAQ